MAFFQRSRIDRCAVTALKQRLDRGEPLAVLDVREEFERALGTIGLPPTAIGLHVPLREVPGRFAEIKAAVGSVPLVVYCHHGMRSMTAATWLAGQGLGPVANLEGGIDAWSAVVDPGVPRY